MATNKKKSNKKLNMEIAEELIAAEPKKAVKKDGKAKKTANKSVAEVTSKDAGKNREEGTCQGVS